MADYRDQREPLEIVYCLQESRGGLIGDQMAGMTGMGVLAVKVKYCAQKLNEL